MTSSSLFPRRQVASRPRFHEVLLAGTCQWDCRFRGVNFHHHGFFQEVFRIELVTPVFELNALVDVVVVAFAAVESRVQVHHSQPWQPLVDEVDLDQYDARVDHAEEGNQSLCQVQLWISKKAWVASHLCINLELEEAKDASKEIGPEGCFAYTLGTLIDEVLSDLEQIFAQAAPSFHKSCQIDNRNPRITLQRHLGQTLQSGCHEKYT